MENSISRQNVNVNVRAIVNDPNVTVQYKTKVLQKNVVGGVNTLIPAMITEANTKYIIKYDYILSDNITIPANCVLEFDGGSVSGEHTITGQNTGIVAGLVKIFGTDVTLAGTWNVKLWEIKWFGANGNGIQDDYQYINAAFNNIPFFQTLHFSEGTYNTSASLNLNYKSLKSEKYAKLVATSSMSILLNINGSYSSTAGLPVDVWSDESYRQTVDGGIFDGNTNAQTTIGCRLAVETTIKNCTIAGGVNYGVNLNSLENEGFGYANIHHCYFNGNLNNITSIGLNCGSDERISNVTIQNYHIAINAAGNIHISNCHVWIQPNAENSFYSGSIAYNIKDSGVYLDNIVVDTYEVGVMLHGNKVSIGQATYMNTSNPWKHSVFFDCDENGGSFNIDTYFEYLFNNSYAFVNNSKVNLIIGNVSNYVTTYKAYEDTAEYLIGKVPYTSDIKYNTVTNAIGWASGKYIKIALNDFYNSNKSIKVICRPTGSNIGITQYIIQAVYSSPYVLCDGYDTGLSFYFDSNNELYMKLPNDYTHIISIESPKPLAMFPTDSINSPAEVLLYYGNGNIPRSGAIRPTVNAWNEGVQYFDTTLGKPIWWNGTAWVDATGATV